jgi:hypothetical protein
MKKLQHFCKTCGATQSQKKYWQYIVNNDPELKDATKIEKRKLVEFILCFYKINESVNFNSDTND